MIGEPFLTALLLIALVVFMLWFALGTQRNIQRGNRLLRWLQTGLPLLGRRTTLRWLGSSAAQLTLRQAHEPFREAEVVVVLEPRDVSLLWAWARARNRRDFLILRGELIRPPGFELEAGDARGWTGRERLQRVDGDAWEASDWGEEHIEVRHTPFAEQDIARRCWGQLREASGGVWRLSIRREAPHVEAHVLPPDTKSVKAERLLAAFRELGERLVEQRPLE
jgi:hypothetical protein